MLSCALGTTTSPFQYQSNNSAGLSSGWATKPSSDMHMWVSTLAMLHTTPRAPPTHRPAPDICSPSPPDAPVDEFSDEVGVAVVAGLLLLPKNLVPPMTRMCMPRR